MDKEHIVCYKSPGNDPLYWKAIATEISFDEINFESSGFILSPFENTRKSFFLPGTGTPTPIPFKPLTANNTSTNRSNPIDEWVQLAEKDRFIENIFQIKQAIQESTVQKVVAYRTAIKTLQTAFDLNDFTNLLFTVFPQAYILVYQYQHQVFITASPELLLQIKDNQASTVALAGTAEWEKRNELGIKESDEQEYIATHIEKLLLSKEISYTKSQKEVLKAGHLAHFFNHYSFELPLHKRHSLLKKLHPTPAVSGFTKSNALHFIKNHEPIPRNWYAGFAGYIEQQESVLSVNIRCLQIINQTAVFFGGAGITKDSNPEKEWDETTLKLQTLLSLF